VAAFYTYILVVPCLLLSFITLVIFWLPPESPAKMILGDAFIPVKTRQLAFFQNVAFVLSKFLFSASLLNRLRYVCDQRVHI